MHRFARGNKLERTDLRKEGRASWSRRRKEKISLADFLLGFCVCYSETQEEVDIFFKFLDTVSLTNKGYKPGEIPSLEGLEKFDFPTYTNREPYNAEYLLIKLSKRLGYIAVSLPIDNPAENSRKAALFYSASKEGCLELIDRIVTNPLNPDISNLSKCYAVSPSQPYF